jgi:hypothetical protein
MKGDFTRDTFHRANHYSRVLQQQGRVTLDADPNEQSAILLHMIRTLARDMIGPYAAPYENGGFVITPAQVGGFMISAGRYYVNGIMIENDAACAYAAQPDYPVPPDDAFAAEIKTPAGHTFGLYLDVWERLITAIDDPLIREQALSGPDTALRAKVVWQVKAVPFNIPPPKYPNDPIALPACEAILSKLVTVSPASMQARIDPGDPPDEPCILPPSARYRGAENQLYRVEIHTGGTPTTATFKWARDNGSRVTAWFGTDGGRLQVADSRGFDAGNWVELTDDVAELQGRPGTLVRITKVEPGALTIDPASQATATPWTVALVRPRVRRWDQVQSDAVVLTNGAMRVQEGTINEPLWINLEDGVQVAFAPGGIYRPGDYWEIPARVATGVEWPAMAGPNNTKVPAMLRPMGVTHHYAPLGFATFVGGTLVFHTCRCVFDPASSCFQLGSLAIGAQLLRAAQSQAPTADLAPQSQQQAQVALVQTQSSEAVLALHQAPTNLTLLNETKR